MKVYKPMPQRLIRVNVRKQGFPTEHITLCECTQKEVYDRIKKIIESTGISIFEKGNITSIDIREAIGGVNGKSISLSFKGMNPDEVIELIYK